MSSHGGAQRLATILAALRRSLQEKGVHSITVYNCEGHSLWLYVRETSTYLLVSSFYLRSSKQNVTPFIPRESDAHIR